MKYTTTLAALREYDACVSGYNKLVCALTGLEFDAYADYSEWIECDHSDPITLSYILNSNGIDNALWALRAVEQTPEFVLKCRLYAIWCVRQVQHLMADSRSIAALDVEERHANGQATDDELAATLKDAAIVTRAAGDDAAAWASVSATWATASTFDNTDTAWAVCVAASKAAGDDDDAWDLARAAGGVDDDAWDLARAAQRAKFVEMFIGDEGK